MYMLPLGVSAPFGPEPMPSAVLGLGGDLAGTFDLNFLGTKMADSAGMREGSHVHNSLVTRERCQVRASHLRSRKKLPGQA